MSPAAGVLEFAVAAPGYERAAPGIHHNSIAVSKCSRDSGVAIAASDNLRLRPDFRAQTPKYLFIFRCRAAGEKNTGAIYILRQLGENHPQPFRRFESQI